MFWNPKMLHLGGALLVLSTTCSAMYPERGNEVDNLELPRLTGGPSNASELATNAKYWDGDEENKGRESEESDSKAAKDIVLGVKSATEPDEEPASKSCTPGWSEAALGLAVISAGFLTAAWVFPDVWYHEETCTDADGEIIPGADTQVDCERVEGTWGGLRGYEDKQSASGSQAAYQQYSEWTTAVGTLSGIGSLLISLGQSLPWRKSDGEDSTKTSACCKPCTPPTKCGKVWEHILKKGPWLTTLFTLVSAFVTVVNPLGGDGTWWHYIGSKALFGNATLTIMLSMAREYFYPTFGNAIMQWVPFVWYSGIFGINGYFAWQTVIPGGWISQTKTVRLSQKLCEDLGKGTAGEREACQPFSKSEKGACVVKHDNYGEEGYTDKNICFEGNDDNSCNANCPKPKVGKWTFIDKRYTGHHMAAGTCENTDKSIDNDLCGKVQGLDHDEAGKLSWKLDEVFESECNAVTNDEGNKQTCLFTPREAGVELWRKWSVTELYYVLPAILLGFGIFAAAFQYCRKKRYCGAQ